MQGHVRTVEVLVEAGADIQARSADPPGPALCGHKSFQACFAAVTIAVQPGAKLDPQC